MPAASDDPDAAASRAGRSLAAPAADHAGRRLGVRRRGGAPHAARPAARRRPRGLRPRAAHPRAVAAAGALVHYLRTTQKVDLAHVRAISFRQRARRAADRSDDAQAPRDSRRLGGRPRRARCSTSSIARSPRWAAALLRAWLLRPLLSLEPIRDRLDAVEELAFRTTDRGKFRDAHQGGPGPRAAGGARRARHRRPARSGRAEAVARGRSARPRRCSPTCRRRSSARCVAELDDLADVRGRDRRHAHRRSAGAGARRRLHARRRRRGARRAARRSAARASR